MLILGQKPCFLGPTIFEISQPNWYYSFYLLSNKANLHSKLGFIVSLLGVWSNEQVISYKMIQIVLHEDHSYISSLYHSGIFI